MSECVIEIDGEKVKQAKEFCKFTRNVGSEEVVEGRKRTEMQWTRQ